MQSLIRDPRNFCVGVLFSLVGWAAILISRDYDFGSTGRMGPGYFPMLLGGMLALIGAVVLARALVTQEQGLERFALREIGLILGSVLLFGVVLRGAGLVPAVFFLVLGSGLASEKFHFGRYCLLASGLAVFSALVFTKGLGLPLALFGPWFGG